METFSAPLPSKKRIKPGFDVMFDQRVAILIPTKGRSKFLKRTLEYYADIKSDHVLFIGDGSNDTEAHQIQRTLAQFDIEIFYFHWPKLNATGTILKLAQEARSQGLRFCAFHGDDDFFIPEALTQTASFLDANPEYKTAHGLASVFRLTSSGPKGKLAWIGDYWGKRQLNEDTAARRLESLCNDYYVLQFATHRIDEFIESTMDYAKLAHYEIAEYLHSLTLGMSGKSKILKIFYLARHAHPDAKHLGRWEQVFRKGWGYEFEFTIEALTKYLARLDSIAPANAETIVRKSLFNLFVGNTSNSAPKYMRYYNILLRSTLKFVPLKLKVCVASVFGSDSDMRTLSLKKNIFHKEFLRIERAFTE